MGSLDKTLVKVSRIPLQFHTDKPKMNCNANGNTCNSAQQPTDVTSTGVQASQSAPNADPNADPNAADPTAVTVSQSAPNADPNAADPMAGTVSQSDPNVDPNAADPMAVTVQCKDMPDDMFCAIVDQVRQAIQGCGVEVDMSFAVKTWLDQTYGNYWTVIIGNAYGLYLSYVPQRFGHFYIGPRAIVVFQNGGSGSAPSTNQQQLNC